MKQIQLTQGLVAFVDDEDFEYLNQWKWYAHKKGNSFYAIRNGSRKDNNGKQYGIKMHRIVLGEIDQNLFVDHIDHNGLNNCKSNLRTATNAENCRNMRIIRGLSKYKGVYQKKGRSGWIARIGGNERKFLGRFNSEEEAAMAYNKAALEIYGEFSYLNEVKCG